MVRDDNEPIRVLEVLGKMNRGGAEAMIMNLYRKMDRQRVQLDFMVHTTEHCLFDDEIEQLGGHIYRVPRFNIMNILSYWRKWRSFFRDHPEIKVVHGHVGATACIYLYEANHAGCFTIAHSHSADTKYRNFRGFTSRVFAWPSRYIGQYLLGCSTEAGIARFGMKIVKSNRYHNFPNAIDLNTFAYDVTIREKVRKSLGIVPDQTVIISVGRVTTQKNPSMIYSVFKEVIAQDTHAVCLWVGTGELEDKYRKKIEEEHLEDKVRMTGVRSDIPQLLMAADCFLFPSLWEGLPVCVIEAQATGLPCVIADTISKEVEVSPLVEWHGLLESSTDWASRCLALAKKNRGIRLSPEDDVRSAGYDINESVKKLTQLYLNHA